MPVRRTIRRSLFPSWPWQRWMVLFLVFTFLFSFISLLRVFYKQNTIIVPTIGGTYIEGSVGELQPLNPWFTVTNNVNRDITSLIFSGLLRYSPETKQIEDDLATMRASTDGHIYDLTLKDDIYWHDSTPEDPHPITVEDVLYTFQTVQDPQFPNSLLRQNFRGVTIEQLDDKTVQFRLEEPYRFFPSNLTLGLVPARSFEGIPASKLDQVLDFGFNPIGAGPYAFRGLVQTGLSSEVTLERFKRTLSPRYHLERIVFRVFPDYSSLLSDLRNLNGVRLAPRDNDGEPLVPRRFHPVNYTLPQYVALFFNLDNAFLQDEVLRLALQLGTDKQSLVDEINESLIVDTPLLEIDVSDWRYKYAPEAAQGALFTSNWHLPEKVRLQRLLEMHETNKVGVLQLSPIVYLDTGALLTITGSLADVGSTGALLNGLPIMNHPTLSGAWIGGLPTFGTGSLHLGFNVIRLENDEGEVVDSFHVWRTNKSKEFKRATKEQKYLELFLNSRTDKVAEEDKISVMDLYLEDGMLRLREDSDRKEVRINNKGEPLSLRLLTSTSPPQYKKIAEILQKQYEYLGIEIRLDIPKTRSEFEEKMLSRDYDILLFGQSLLDNLDSYPYWHSSGIQKETEDRNELLLDAYNLSQYKSLDADSLLELIRQTGNATERESGLEELREVLKKDVPAIFLYSPLYTFAYHQDVQGVELGNLTLHSDRFLTLHKWYVKEHRIFMPGKGWGSFFGWLF